MLLLPATFDHLGGLGPLSHRFLFGSPAANPGPPLDTYTHCDLPTTVQTLISRATGPSALLGLLPAADQAFRRSCPRRWYGPTYHTRTPRQWAVQFLGLNLTRAYARHLYTARDRLSSSSSDSPPPGFSTVFRLPRTGSVSVSRPSTVSVSQRTRSSTVSASPRTVAVARPTYHNGHSD
jgi:hypothetical protein